MLSITLDRNMRNFVTTTCCFAKLTGFKICFVSCYHSDSRYLWQHYVDVDVQVELFNDVHRELDLSRVVLNCVRCELLIAI